jgi:hypothetical protein
MIDGLVTEDTQFRGMTIRHVTTPEHMALARALFEERSMRADCL